MEEADVETITKVDTKGQGTGGFCAGDILERYRDGIFTALLETI